MEYFTLSGFLTFLIWIQRFFGFFPKKRKKDLRLLLTWTRADTTPTVLCIKMNFNQRIFGLIEAFVVSVRHVSCWFVVHVSFKTQTQSHDARFRSQISESAASCCPSSRPTRCTSLSAHQSWSDNFLSRLWTICECAIPRSGTPDWKGIARHPRLIQQKAAVKIKQAEDWCSHRKLASYSVNVRPADWHEFTALLSHRTIKRLLKSSIKAICKDKNRQLLLLTAKKWLQTAAKRLEKSPQQQAVSAQHRTQHSTFYPEKSLIIFRFM